MNNQPLITVAICTYNRADYLADTLKYLAPQAAEISFCEILVIDNNSTDHTVDVCQKFGADHPGLNFRYVSEIDQGLSFARNRAVSESAADSILYIDDDVIPSEHLLASAAEYLNQYPDILCAGGRIFVTFDEGKPEWIPEELMPMFGLHDLGDEAIDYPKNNFPRGGNMLIRKKAFELCGLFDTELGRKGSVLLGSEEKAFFARARKQGIQLMYWPRMALHHRIGPQRLNKSYLRNQSVGIGRSERIRVQASVSGTMLKLLSEVIKLAGSFVLSLNYIIKGKWGAAALLIKFRLWVLAGFLQTGHEPV